MGNPALFETLTRAELLAALRRRCVEIMDLKAMLFEHRIPFDAGCSIEDDHLPTPDLRKSSAERGGLEGLRNLSGNFSQLQQLVLYELRRRVRTGASTERGLAVAIGISQPHMHNVLKGARALSLKKTDAVLGYLGLSVWDLAQQPASAKVERVS